MGSSPNLSYTVSRLQSSDTPSEFPRPLNTKCCSFGDSQLPRLHGRAERDLRVLLGSLSAPPVPSSPESCLATLPSLVGQVPGPYNPPGQVGMLLHDSLVPRPGWAHSYSLSVLSLRRPGFKSCCRAFVVLAKPLALSGPQRFPPEDGMRFPAPPLALAVAEYGSPWREVWIHPWEWKKELPPMGLKASPYLPCALLSSHVLGLGCGRNVWPGSPALPCGTSGGSLQLSEAEISMITAAQHVLRVDGVLAHSRNSAPGRACAVPLFPRCCSVTKFCLTLCSLMDCGLPGSSVHGIPQTRVLEWVAVSFSRGSSDPGIKPTCLSFFWNPHLLYLLH